MKIVWPKLVVRMDGTAVTRIFRSRPNTNATIRFMVTPAASTSSVSLCLFLKFCGFTTTGLPQPKPMKTRDRMPIRSTWAWGSIVQRPMIFGVTSPLL